MNLFLCIFFDFILFHQRTYYPKTNVHFELLVTKFALSCVHELGAKETRTYLSLMKLAFAKEIEPEFIRIIKMPGILMAIGN